MRRSSALGLGLVMAALSVGLPWEAWAGEKYALLVGVKQYRKSELRGMQFTENDVSDLANVLQAGGYRPENIVLLTKAHADAANDLRFLPLAQNIHDELDLLLAEVQAGDTIIVAFSGHGVQFKDDPAAYFCPADARLKDRSTLLSLDEVYESLAACRATTRLLFVDACRNDPHLGVEELEKGTIELAPAGLRPPAAIPGGVVALMSCAAQERSYEDKDLRHGVFFHYLIEGLRGKADLAAAGQVPDRQITLAELEEYTVRNTQRYVRGKLGIGQTPQRRGDVQGSLALVSLPSRTAPPTAPRLLDVIRNSIGMRLVLVPAGQFAMGSPAGEKNREGDETLHRVRLTRDFFLGQTEVTVGQFRAFIAETRYKTSAEKADGGWGWNQATRKLEGPNHKYSWRNTGFAQTDNHPVVNVTWVDAQRFVRWLSDREKIEYRLPTEAEWEYACRAGTMTAYSSGSDPEGLAQSGNVPDATAKKSFADWSPIKAADGFVFTAPVAQFRANRFKLFDMHGNVSEWCADWYGGYSAGAAVNPLGAADGSQRVFRGGCWYGNPRPCRSANREQHTPGYRNCHVGFRVVAVASVGQGRQSLPSVLTLAGARP